jgi:Na+/H+ antiporter NhaC
MNIIIIIIILILFLILFYIINNNIMYIHNRVNNITDKYIESFISEI